MGLAVKDWTDPAAAPARPATRAGLVRSLPLGSTTGFGGLLNAVRTEDARPAADARTAAADRQSAADRQAIADRQAARTARETASERGAARPAAPAQRDAAARLERTRAAPDASRPTQRMAVPKAESGPGGASDARPPAAKAQRSDGGEGAGAIADGEAARTDSAGLLAVAEAAGEDVAGEKGEDPEAEEGAPADSSALPVQVLIPVPTPLAGASAASGGSAPGADATAAGGVGGNAAAAAGQAQATAPGLVAPGAAGPAADGAAAANAKGGQTPGAAESFSAALRGKAGADETDPAAVPADAVSDALKALAPPADPSAVRAVASPHAAGPAHGAAGAAPAPAPVPLGQVPMTIGLRSLAGSSQFEIRLDPGDLGRIDVTLEIDKARGTVTTHLVVERPETLAMLQRDAGSLQQALSQAGLDSSESGINLSLRSDGGTGQDPSRQDSSQDSPGRGQSRGRDAWTADQPVPVEAATLRGLRGYGGLDIRI